MKTRTKILAGNDRFRARSGVVSTPKKRKKVPLGEETFWTLRPEDDLKKSMAAAMEATGSERQAIIFDCIREMLPEIVRRTKARRDEAAKFFDRRETAPEKP